MSAAPAGAPASAAQAGPDASLRAVIVTWHDARREFNRFATLLTRMGLSQLEARKLYEVYRTLDTDNSGVISGEEFKVRTW